MSTKHLRLLVIEDSGYMLMAIRTMVKLDPGIEIIGEAQNGSDGVKMALALAPDLITMDVNMPGLDGIEATRQIMSKQPTAIVTLSSMTEKGQAVTAQALEAGAIDFIPKSMSAVDVDLATIAKQVSQKIRFWGEHCGFEQGPEAPTVSAVTDIVVLAGGAGSPLAVGAMVADLEGCEAPILVSVDVLPAIMTDAYVDYLGRLTKRPTRAAAHRGALLPGTVTVVPGGRSAQIERSGDALTTKLMPAGAGDLLGSCATAASHPQLVLLSGAARPVEALSAIIATKPMIVCLQPTTTCSDAGLVEAARTAGIPTVVLPIKSRLERTAHAA